VILITRRVSSGYEYKIKFQDKVIEKEFLYFHILNYSLPFIIRNSKSFVKKKQNFVNSSYIGGIYANTSFATVISKIVSGIVRFFCLS